jgi:hypothetical protein
VYCRGTVSCTLATHDALAVRHQHSTLRTTDELSEPTPRRGRVHCIARELQFVDGPSQREVRALRLV